MPPTRHRKSNSSNKSRLTHEQKVDWLSRRGNTIDPTNRAQIARKYREARRERIPADMLHKVPGKNHKQKATSARSLRAHGFRIVGDTVVVDSPRNRRRNIIKGSRTRVLSGGVVTQSVKNRRDYIYGFTRKEKQEFAKDPAAFEKKIIRRMLDRFPALRKARKRQVRLRWGAYQGTKNFAPTYFTTKYFAESSPEEIRRVGKRKAEPRSDKLTGFHIVIHVPEKKRRRRKGK